MFLLNCLVLFLCCLRLLDGVGVSLGDGMNVSTFLLFLNHGLLYSTVLWFS